MEFRADDADPPTVAAVAETLLSGWDRRVDGPSRRDRARDEARLLKVDSMQSKASARLATEALDIQAALA
jgi:hypothetical protein